MSIWQSNPWKNLVLKSYQASDVFEIDWIIIEKRSIWFWKYWLFSLWIENIQKLDEEKLINLCKKEKCLFIQLETFWIDNKINLELKKFKEWYYKKFITPYTALIDLSKSKEEILSEMKPKWRYNIGLAKKKWVQVFEVEKSKENIKIFYNLMLETTSRDWFYWNTFEYYENFLEIIPWSALIFTKFWDKILSAWIFVFDKDISIYYYWASTSNKNYRNLMAPYLMQWFAIEKSLEIWSKYYDFLWVSTPWDKKSHLMWVTDFKLKFTSDIRKVSESYMWVNNKFLYKLLTIIKNLKRLGF
jgi:lipid II:glycine glycyltransferase (peptidoglycan interpeptide bridge formation enzyme)